MSKAPKPRLRTIDIDAADAEAVAYAKEQGLPSTAAGEGALPTRVTTTLKRVTKPAQAKSRRIHINVPIYAIKDLKDRATADDTTLRYVVLTALRAFGIDIKDVDMIEDGRRVAQ